MSARHETNACRTEEELVELATFMVTDDGKAEAIEAHLATCERCTARATELFDANEPLAEEEEEPPPELLVRINEEIDRKRATRAADRSGRRFPFWLLLVLAAVLGVTVVARGEPGAPQAPPPPPPALELPSRPEPLELPVTAPCAPGRAEDGVSVVSSRR